MKAAVFKGLYTNESLPETPVLSNEVRDLLGKLLEDNPQKRASLPNFSRHPWFKSHPSEWIGNELVSMTSRPIQVKYSFYMRRLFHAMPDMLHLAADVGISRTRLFHLLAVRAYNIAAASYEKASSCRQILCFTAWLWSISAINFFFIVCSQKLRFWASLRRLTSGYRKRSKSKCERNKCCALSFTV